MPHPTAPDASDVAKFTPGPWHVGGALTHIAVVYSADGWPVSDARTYHGRITTEATEANARLIAAAPELLAAVQRARRHAMNIGIDSGSYVDQLDAAIAKATQP